MVDVHGLIERAKTSRVIILAVSTLICAIGAVVVLASLGTSLPARAPTGLDVLIYSATFRWSTIACFVVTVTNFCASWFNLEALFIVTSGAAWWSLPSVATLLFSGFIIGPLLVIIGTLGSFFTWLANYRLTMNPNEAGPISDQPTHSEDPSGQSENINQSSLKKILFAANFISYGVGFVMLGVEIMEVFGSSMPLPKIQYDIADRLLFMLLQSAYTMLLVLFWHFSINVNCELVRPNMVFPADGVRDPRNFISDTFLFLELFQLLCLIGYFIASSFGYALRLDTMSRVAGIFLFVSGVLSAFSILFERVDIHLHFGGVRDRLKPNIISLVALAVSVIGFIMFSISLGSISSVWTSFAVVLVISINLACVLSSQHEFFWLAWGMSLNAIPFVVFIPILRGDPVGIAGGAILLFSAIASFISIKTFDLSTPSGNFLNYGLFLLILPFAFGGIFAGSSPLFIMQAILLGSMFPLFNHFQINSSARVTPFALGVLFACSLEYWAPASKSGSDIFAPLIAVAILIISIAMIVMTVIYAKRARNQGVEHSNPEVDPELHMQQTPAPSSPAIVEPHPEPLAILELSAIEERAIDQQRALGPYVSDHVDDRFNYSL